jgi:predicted GH43/DUF377 family glycosyl hydrolase
MSLSAPPVQRLHGGRPVISKDERHDWENKVTFNPACALVDTPGALRKLVESLPAGRDVKERLLREKALVGILYRAQGKKTASYDHTRSSVGLAVCTPGLELLVRLDNPVILPEEPYENLGVEDARITRIGGLYWMVYTGYSSGPEKNAVRICFATSDDLVHWKKLGPLEGDFNTIDNKNGMLFEPAPGVPYRMLHRPMEGDYPMMIHWAECDSLTGRWKSRGVLMPWLPNPAFKDVWVGGGAPPLLLPDGRYLVVYHIGNRDTSGQREYDLGIAVIDPRRQDPVIKRTEPLLRPETPAETTGDADLGVNNVVFVGAAYFWEGDLYIPYAGADSCVLGAKIAREDLDRFIAP